MPLSRFCPSSVWQGYQFLWQPYGLTYLGTEIPQQLGNATINLLPVIHKIELMLQNLTKLGLSLLGKINISERAIVHEINHISYRLLLTLPGNTLSKYN